MARGIEVELKARVDDLGRVERLLAGKARPLDEIDYADTYFTFPGTTGFSFHRFRLRQYRDRALVTVKEKKPGEEGGVRESEFEVSDPAAFLDFARVFGAEVMLKKRKSGKRFQFGGGTEPGFARGPVIELVRIEGLGDFVEIEIMVDEPAQAARAQARIRELLDELGLPESAVEQRAYTFLLYEKNKRS